MPLDRSFLRLTPEELEEFLTNARTVRIATVSPKGFPHVAPLWFLWIDGSMYVNSLKRSKRGAHLAHGSRVACCVDDGDVYAELRGAVLYGKFQDVTEQAAELGLHQKFIDKYWDDVQIPESRAHLWFKLTPTRTTTWDFRKIPTEMDPRLRAIAAKGQHAAEG